MFVIYRTCQSWLLLRVRLCLRHASFPLVLHIAVSSSAVRVGYAECGASSKSESNRHSIIDCQSTLGLNKRWHFIVLGSGPKNRRQYRAAHKSPEKQLPRQPNCQGRERGSRKCHGCGTVLRKPETYIMDWINQDLQAVCMDCHTGLVPDEIPEPFDYEALWWQKLSRKYRKEKGWRCEKCKLLLSYDTDYLHTHHIRGTQYNKREDLKALCIGCHSEQPGDNHQKLKKKPEYRDFMKKYGKRWKSLTK